MTCYRCGADAPEPNWQPYCVTCWFWLFDGPVDRTEDEQAELEKRYPMKPLSEPANG